MTIDGSLELSFGLKSYKAFPSLFALIGETTDLLCNFLTVVCKTTVKK